MKVRLRTSVSRRRRNRGVSLTELLVGSLLLGVSLAVVAELMSLCVVSSTKMSRQFDAQTSVNTALDRLKRDIRMAKEIRSETNEFGSVKKTSSARTLILHMPIFYLNKRNDPNDPSYDPGAAQDSLNGFTLPGYYAVLYELIPDPERLGEFMLTISTRRTPVVVAEPNSSYREIVDNQILVKGIVGPLEQGGSTGSIPKVFSYVAKNPNQEERLDLIQEGALYDQSVMNGVNGVGVDFEIKRGELAEADTADTPLDKTVGVHAEVCMRLPQNAQGRRDVSLYEP
jgi:hypothetical protein